MYTGFIKTRSKPSIYYMPKEHNDKTTKTLHESQERVKSKCSFEYPVLLGI